MRAVEKLVELPHAKSVIAGRGAVDVLHAIAKVLERERTDFDGMRERLKSLVSAVVLDFQASLRSAHIPFEPFGQEIVLVGLSKSARRICAARFFFEGDQYYMEDHERGCAPGDGIDLSAIAREPFSKDAMLQAARRQVAWGRENGQAHILGGSLIHAEITPKRVVISNLGPI